MTVDTAGVRSRATGTGGGSERDRRPAPGPRRGAGSLRRERVFRLLFLAPAVVYMLLFFGYPVVKNIVMSFQDYTTTTFFTGSAPFIGLRNYVSVISAHYFGTALLNTALFTVISIVGQFVLGLLIALFFKRSFPLNGLLRSLLLLPWLLPLIVSSAVWKWILDQDSGVLNQVLQGLHVVAGPVPWLTSTSIALLTVIGVNIWIGIPFNTTILYSGLQDIPEELYEAGSLDGATGWKAFRHITWPMLRPVVSVVLVLGVVYTIKVLDIILGLTNGGPANSTQTIATQSYQLSFQQFSFGKGAALSDILIVISAVFAVVYLRATRRAIDE
ncbi:MULTISPECIES: carbohydrate ABC transporter permease [unclassified Curtobacterium]|uniref:carbohydrate ABC transporter permease n=1 Tax=unclassified Curtobacterium TaxID=257496 RepID=UPI000DA97349|nr:MULTISPECIES: sugar ABC transporter permease [unclassified Curtobacterium]PZE29888.1 sugar ABC transporter permease [Curtobacterium sp. MCBD17_028]PZE75707.1 sugar ABC transporter permease [Curtobacterium sp. MCBD17_019]PZF60930.1 sugar ABC transporter permease [Curtobacterium sp. MCBD17_034]PZF66332.1 sugar ABC transporter permease [Curtobacterium sp. MCBD17_013]PZM40280.1 sugar ABC transporter permease [Curtobacterium sp. MCBD17_031]